MVKVEDLVREIRETHPDILTGYRSGEHYHDADAARREAVEWMTSDDPTAQMSWYVRPDDIESAHLVEIPGTGWSGYSGSVYSRAAARVLAEDYRGHVLTVEGWYESEAVALVVGTEIPETLADDVRHLVEYGYLDVETHDIEAELAQEAWDSWLGSDFREAVKQAIVGPEGDGDDADEIVPSRDDLWPLVTVEHRDVESGKHTWECETATDATLTDWERLAATIADDIMREYLVPAEIPGQGALV